MFGQSRDQALIQQLRGWEREVPGEKETKGSSNLNLTAGPRPESGTPLPSRLRSSWLPSQPGPGPVLVPPRDASETQKDRSILSQAGWGMAQFVPALGGA